MSAAREDGGGGGDISGFVDSGVSLDATTPGMGLAMILLTIVTGI
jgi:hypothetical protein